MTDVPRETPKGVQVLAMTGDQMKQVRHALGLSIDVFGDLLGLCGRGRTVRKYERGERFITGPIARLVLALAGGWRPSIPYMTMDFQIAEAVMTGRLVQRARDDYDRLILEGDGTGRNMEGILPQAPGPIAEASE